MSFGIILVLSYHLKLTHSLPFPQNFEIKVVPYEKYIGEDGLSHALNLTSLSAVAGAHCIRI